MELRLPSLYYRRQCSYMIFLYQIFSSLVDIDVNERFTKSTGITRGRKLKIYTCHCSCLPRINYFSYCVVNPWNKLPEHLIEACSLNDFKVKLDMHWTNKYTILVYNDLVCTGYFASLPK